MITFHITATTLHKQFFGGECIIDADNIDSMISNYSLELERKKGSLSREIYGSIVDQLKLYKLFFDNGATYTCDDNFVIQNYDDDKCMLSGSCSSKGKIESRLIKNFLTNPRVGKSKKINDFFFEIVNIL
jgi:hypothetical protein